MIVHLNQLFYFQIVQFLQDKTMHCIALQSNQVFENSTVPHVTTKRVMYICLSGRSEFYSFQEVSIC